MDGHAAQAIPAEAPGAPPAASPPASTEPEVTKTPDELAADKNAADEAKQKQDADDAEEEEKVKKKPWFQKRLDEMARQRHTAERRADRLEQMLQQTLEAVPKNKPTAEAPKPAEFQPTTAPPTREQFDFDEDKYIDARYQWLTEQREAKAAHEKRTAEQQGSQQEFVRSYEAQRTATVNEGREKYPDFESVVFALPPNVLNPEMALAIFNTATPADVAYHLGKNPEEARRIAALPPLKKAIELGKLEARLTAAPPKTTQAPPVIKPIRGAEPAKTDSAKLARTDPIKWIELRNAGKL